MTAGRHEGLMQHGDCYVTYCSLDNSFGDGIILIEHRNHIHGQQVFNCCCQVLLEGGVCRAKQQPIVPTPSKQADHLKVWK